MNDNKVITAKAATEKAFAAIKASHNLAQLFSDIDARASQGEFHLDLPIPLDNKVRTYLISIGYKVYGNRISWSIQ